MSDLEAEIVMILGEHEKGFEGREYSSRNAKAAGKHEARSAMGNLFCAGFSPRQTVGNEGWTTMEADGSDTCFLVVVRGL